MTAEIKEFIFVVVVKMSYLVPRQNTILALVGRVSGNP